MTRGAKPGGKFFGSSISIRTKLVIIFLFVSILPLFVISFVSYRLAFQNVQMMSVDNFANIVDQLNKNIELVLMDSRNYLKIGQSPEMVSFLTKTTDKNLEYEHALGVVNLFKTYRELFDYNTFIENVVILNKQGRHIGEQRGVYSLPVQIDHLSIVKRIEESPYSVSIIPNSVQDYSSPVTRKSLLSICSVIRKPVTHEEIGYIIINLNMSVIQELVDNISMHPAGDFFIVENQDSILSPVNYKYEAGDLDEEYILQIAQKERGFFHAEYHGVSSFFVFNTLRLTEWKIIGRSDRRDLLSNAIAIKNISLTVAGLTVTLSVLIYLYLSFRITLPIKKLKNCMYQVEKGNLNLYADVYSHDEIGDLCVSFNVMVQKIKDLIELTRQEQELAKKMEFKALQAQINPHFLYNSLESILWMAQAGKKEEIITMTRSLSSLFRIILSKGDEKIPIRDEMQHIQSYLIIQKIRYRDILNYEIDIPEEYSDYKIIKILLQPLVENSLYHGIKNTRVMGVVRIQARESGDCIVFTVEDNGSGMSGERLRELREIFSSDDDKGLNHTSYGLHNVNQRLKLEYGIDFSLHIESTLGKGTCVTIRIPKEK